MKPTTAILAIAAVALALASSGAGNPHAEVRWAVNHCRNDAMCFGGRNACCFKRCVDLRNDRHHCGACRRKCWFNEVCCAGRCVNLSYDGRHCGACNRACVSAQSCVHGMCGYA